MDARDTPHVDSAKDGDNDALNDERHTVVVTLLEGASA